MKVRKVSKKKTTAIIFGAVAFIVLCFIVGFFAISHFNANDSTSNIEANANTDFDQTKNETISENESYNENSNSSISNTNRSASQHNAINGANENTTMMPEHQETNTSTSTSEIAAENRALLENDFTGLASGTRSASDMIADLSDIHIGETSDYAYRLANGESLTDVFAGTERRNIVLTKVSLISSISGIDTFKVEYDFLMHRVDAMDSSGTGQERSGHATATIMMNQNGKIVSWTEDIDWL